MLRFGRSEFHISTESLSTLRPGEWLNDEIIIGALRLLTEASNNGVQLVDSVAKNAPGIDFHKAKVLLPMLIEGNHWVLGVYKSTGLLVYDPLPSLTARNAIWSKARSILGGVFQKDDKDGPEMTITAPLLQANTDDCGVFTIIAGFHETMGLGINPLEIDAAFWRDVLLRLLSPQPCVEQDVPVETHVDLSGLPANARFSELDGILSQFLHTISTSLRQHSDASQKKVASAELVLDITRRAKQGAVEAGFPDAIARFQHAEAYCEEAIERWRRELELRQRIDSLTRVSVTN